MSDQSLRTQTMTVARVRAAGMDFEVMFFESARIYRLQRTNPAFEATLRELRSAGGSGAPVSVVLTTPNGDVIESAKVVR